MKLVLDTNIFITGFLDMADNRESDEVIILKKLAEKKHALVLSDKLEEQILRVIARVKDRNFVGLVRHLMWSDFSIHYIIVNREKHKGQFPEIPRKDLDIFLTALQANADFLISNDGVFLEKASMYKTSFVCSAPSEFIRKQ